MKGLVYSACVRSSMTYGAETWPLQADQERMLERAENRMVRWMNGVSLKDRLTSKELRENLQIENIAEVVRRARLRWFAHVERKDDEDWVKRTTRLEIEGSRPAGSLRRPGMRQSKLILGGLDSTQVKPATEKLRDKPYTLQVPTQAHLEYGLENDEENDEEEENSNSNRSSRIRPIAFLSGHNSISSNLGSNKESLSFGH